MSQKINGYGLIWLLLAIGLIGLLAISFLHSYIGTTWAVVGWIAFGIVLWVGVRKYFKK